MKEYIFVVCEGSKHSEYFNDAGGVKIDGRDVHWFVPKEQIKECPLCKEKVCIMCRDESEDEISDMCLDCAIFGHEDLDNGLCENCGTWMSSEEFDKHDCIRDTEWVNSL